MDNETLKKQLYQIDEEVGRLYFDSTGRTEPIYDGVVAAEKYLSAKYKILWVLKEPWDDKDEIGSKGGGWSLVRDILGVENIYGKIGRSPTYHPMIYVCYSALNNFPAWDQMNYIRNKPEMANVMRDIAYINVKKTPGYTRTDDAQICAWYEKAKGLLWKQIDALCPDILIGCRPHMPLIMRDAGIIELTSTGSVRFGVAQNRLYIEAYHPAQSTIDRQTYVDDLINTIRSFSSLQKH